VLYEAITGHYYLEVPPHVQNDESMARLIAEARPLPLEPRHESIPAELSLPLMRALRKNPAERPPNARAFLSEIRNAAARSKHATLSQKYRSLEPRAAHAQADLLRKLYAVRTLRDADHQPERARAQLQIIWETSPGVPEVAAEWGETLVALGRPDEGHPWLERAIRMKPELPFAQLALADLYRASDENDDAAEDAVVLAIHADPDLVYAVLYEDIVASLEDPEKYEDYLIPFRRAASERPTAPTLHNLGQVLALNSAHEHDALATFADSISHDPDYGPAYVGLGSALIELGELDRALALLEQGTYGHFPTLSPDDWHKTNTVYQRAHAFLALAIAYAQTGQYESSAIAARSVLDLAPSELEKDAPELLDAYCQAASVWIERGAILRAYKFLNQVIPIAAHWGNTRIFGLLELSEGKVDASHRRKQQWDEAVDWLKTSLLNLRGAAPGDSDARELPL
jgi:tetratricopeptide (TPR) repeat protein